MPFDDEISADGVGVVGYRPEWAQEAGALACDLRNAVPASLAVEHIRAAIAADPTGSSFGLELPYEPPFTDQELKPLSKAMTTLLQDAIAHADDHSGIPTGIVVQHDRASTAATLMFDNLVDGGAWTTPSKQTSTAPPRSPGKTSPPALRAATSPTSQPGSSKPSTFFERAALTS